VFVDAVELNSLGIYPLHQLKTSLKKVGKDFEGEEKLEDSLAVFPSIVSDGTSDGSTVYSKDNDDTAKDGNANGTVDDDCQDDSVLAQSKTEVLGGIVDDGTAVPSSLNKKSRK
jgi:hypothetical protein